MIRVTCPNCQQSLKAPPEAVGRRGKCKQCGYRFVVPAGNPGSELECTVSNTEGQNPPALSDDELGRAISGYAADLMLAGAPRMDIFRRLGEIGLDVQAASVVVAKLEDYFAGNAVQQPVPLALKGVESTEARPVPMEVALPMGCGEIKTQVSQKTADDVMK